MTEQQLEKYARDIVGQFLQEKVALNDGVTAAAEQNNLTPEQIKRLVEAVNTATFLQKFNNPSPDATDRIVEFETADADAVLNRLLDHAQETMTPGEATPCEEMAELPETRPERAAEKAPEKDPEEDKTAAAHDDEDDMPVRKDVLIMRLRKTAELLHEQSWQARNDYTEATQELLQGFRKIGQSYEAFEKDAFYHHGDDAVPHLQFLRRALRKSAATYTHTEAVKHAHIVDTTTPEMRLLARMIKSAHNAALCEEGQRKVEEYLGRL